MTAEQQKAEIAQHGAEIVRLESEVKAKRLEQMVHHQKAEELRQTLPLIATGFDQTVLPNAPDDEALMHEWFSSLPDMAKQFVKRMKGGE